MASTTSTPALTQKPLRRRASIRERFWSRTSANYHGEEDASDCASSSRPRIYVPVSAASGFAKTVKSPHAESRRAAAAHLAPMREDVVEDINDEKHHHGDEFTPKTTPLSRLLAQPGHLYTHTDPPSRRGGGSDYDTFLSAARTNEYAQRILAASSSTEDPFASTNGSSSPAKDYRSSSGSSSSPFTRLWDGARSATSSEPKTSPAPAATEAAKGLRRQKSIRVIGQRIAEYVRPMRPEVASAQQRYSR